MYVYVICMHYTYTNICLHADCVAGFPVPSHYQGNLLLCNIHNHMQIHTLQISKLVPTHTHLHMHIQTLQHHPYMDIALQICCRIHTEPHSASIMKSSRSWPSSSSREVCSNNLTELHGSRAVPVHLTRHPDHIQTAYP